MKTRLEEVKDMQKNAMKTIVEICQCSYDYNGMKDYVEEYVQLRIEQAMIEKGVVHG